MPRNNIIPYNPKLKQFARDLRNNSTLSEVLLWRQIKGQTLKHEFHRQVPIDEFIVDFYCHELMLAVEIDGDSHSDKYDYDMSRQRKLQDLGGGSCTKSNQMLRMTGQGIKMKDGRTGRQLVK